MPDDATTPPDDLNAPLQPLFLFSDEPVLEFEKTARDDAKRFARTIAGTVLGVNGPFNIGVFAGWGQGKTSALRLAQDQLDREARSPDKPEGHDIVTVWVNAWKYEHDNDPILPLIACMVDAIEQKQAKLKALELEFKDGQELTEPQRTRKQIVERTKTFYSRAKRALRAIGYGTNAKVKLGLPGFAEVEAGFVAKEMIDRDDDLARTRDPLLDQSIYYKADTILEELYRGFADEKEISQTKIVVFIDDLDRCFPKKALDLLESIKLVLAHPGFVFCMAIDRDVIDAYLRKRYEQDYGLKEYGIAGGGHYLDKLIQLPLYLPRAHEAFEKHVAFELEQYEQRLDNFYKGDLPENTRQVIDALKDSQEAITLGTDANPRALVRLLNRLLIDSRLWQGQPAEDQKKVSIEQFISLAAISRLLEDRLGHKDYEWLVDAGKQIVKILQVFIQQASKNSTTLLDEIEFALEKNGKLSTRATVGDNTIMERNRAYNWMGSMQRESRSYAHSLHGRFESICAKLDERPYLKKMLLCPHGEAWLKDTNGRELIENYLAASRQPEDEQVEEPKQSFEELAAIINDKDKSDSQRKAAISLLAVDYPEHTQTPELLWQCLKDKQDIRYVRERALHGLIKTNNCNEDLRAYLVNLLRDKDEAWWLRCNAIRALNRHWLEDNNVRQLIIEVLKDKEDDRGVRGIASYTLAKHWKGDEDIRHLLIQCLADSDDATYTRSQVVMGLAEYWQGNSEVRYALIDFLSKPPEDLFFHSEWAEDLVEQYKDDPELRDLFAKYVEKEDEGPVGDAEAG